MSGARKAAVLALVLEEDAAGLLMQQLTDQELERLTAEISRAGVVHQSEVLAVLEEFEDLCELHGYLKEGGPERAVELIERTLPPDRARRLLDLVETYRDRLPLAFLARADTERLAETVAAESDETAAVILAHMTPGKAAKVLEKLAPERRDRVLAALAALERVDPQVLETLGSKLRRALAEDLETGVRKRRSGREALEEILRAAGPSADVLLESLRKADPALAEAVEGRLFVFEDLALLDDRSVQRLLKEIDRRDLALALKSAPPAVRDKIFRNLSRRAAQALREEMDYLGPVRLRDVEAARKTVVETALALASVGEIWIEGRGRGEDRLVY